MTQVLQLAIAFGVGLGAAVQVAMLAAIQRERAPLEAGWISILGTAVGLAVLLAIRAGRGDGLELPSPFDRAWLFATVAVLAAAGLAVAFRSGQAYLAVAGLFGAAFIVAAASLAPRLGVALLLSAVTAGTLAGALTMDHLGAFGGEVQRVTVTRLVGVLVVMAGVVIVRSR